MARRVQKTGGRRTLRKVTDDSLAIRLPRGRSGTIREEVWVNERDEVAKYNLAFISFGLCQIDNGRVLGYDNAHGEHERHFMGTVQPWNFVSYTQTAQAFYDEVAVLRSRR